MENILFIKQCTLKKTITIYGFGLHSGKKVKLNLKPNKDNSGIIFRRIDFKVHVDIPALITNVIKTKFATVLCKNNVYIKTTEHLLSAIYTLGIDNILIEVNSEEIPIMDGSSYPFIYLLKLCGKDYLSEFKRFFKIKKMFNINISEKFVIIFPSKNKKFIFYLKNNNDKKKYLYFKNTFKKYILNVSKSRTFGYYSNYPNLLFNDLAKGAMFNNVLIFYYCKIFNRNILRYKNEDIKHKLLDFIGDLSLTGCTNLCSFLSIMPGHSLNNFMLNNLLYKPYLYDIALFHKNHGFIKI